MRELYRKDKEQAIKGKPLKEWTKQEIDDAFFGVCLAAKEYIKLTTKSFFKHKKDIKKKQGRHTFTIAVKTGIINTIPHEYNEKFIKRMKKLTKISESFGYTMQFSKWRTSKEYGWYFMREADQ
ncbi:MAG: hypothetical protein V3V70_07385 [Candidatus Scalindua sp.]|jgi:hypothetical protein|tara:strand:+ start:886 stop:1257 length:372 start_codon:yes stop_codon:yes gene_type:complete